MRSSRSSSDSPKSGTCEKRPYGRVSVGAGDAQGLLLYGATTVDNAWIAGGMTAAIADGGLSYAIHATVGS